MFPGLVHAQTSDNLLVVINENSADSIQIGEYYVRKRSVPQDRVVRLKTAAADAISRGDYERTIEFPIAGWLTRHRLQDKVLYLVLTKGIPLRVSGSDGREGTVASVDSELTLLYRKLTGVASPFSGRVQNPYYLGDKPLTEAKPFTRFLADIYLVTRLDGFSIDDVLKMIDRGVAPVSDGKVVLDQRSNLVDAGGDRWLSLTAERLREGPAGDRVVLEMSRALAAISGPVMGYYSWGSNDASNRQRRTGLAFVNGAIGGMFVSTDGRTFIEPPADWVPVDSTRVGGQFGRGSQSLAGDLIRDGLTGVSANVNEPYLDAIVRPQILFPAYLAGFTLGESFYLAMPFLSWQTVIIGDPLCTPFPRQALAPEQISKEIDPDTELPALFSERRLAVATRGGLRVEAIKLALKADVRSTAGKDDEAEGLLVKATELEPRLISSQLRLGSRYDARADYDAAIDRYRKVIAVDPQNVIALNNLAYALADRKGVAKEALPFAERAYKASGQAPLVADTLGWVHHLLGDDKTAVPLIEQALSGASNNVDVLIHAAIVHAALGDVARARKELETAEKLDGKIADRADVKALRARVK